MSEQVKVAKAAGVVGAATLASRVMGYVRDMVMSWAFGTGLAADAFYVAYRIPNLLRELLAEGSMSAAFIPVFTETLTKESRESARHLANAVFARLLVILVVLTGLGIIFAPYVVKVVAWGWAYKAEHDKYVLGVTLTRIMFPYLLFIGLAALAMGMLNSLRSVPHSRAFAGHAERDDHLSGVIEPPVPVRTDPRRRCRRGAGRHVPVPDPGAGPQKAGDDDAAPV